MDDTPNLALPYIFAAQSQKHVTHNEAIRALDALVQLSVLDKDLASPPASPAEGDRYVVAASPAGAWAGQANKVAAWQDGAWAFYAAKDGWIAWVADENLVYAYDGGAWATLSPGGGPASFARVGVNATADATNKLSVSSPAALFNHDGAGHQVKVNKNAAGDTASFLFQTNFSGRAEIGTAGDDDFHFKVSADGTTFREAIKIDRTNGRVSFPSGGAREVLTAARTYYVRTDGSDSNNGLANTAGGAFLTPQRAADVALGLDLNGYAVTIQIADGTYGGLNISGPFAGNGYIEIIGNTSSPGNVILSVSSGDAALYAYYGFVYAEGVEFRSSGGTRHGILADASAWADYANCRFGACSGAQVCSRLGGVARALGAYTIAGNAPRHMYADRGHIDVRGRTVTLSGTPAFSTAFAEATRAGDILASGNTYSGPATGKRYDATKNGVIDVGGAAVTYFPGDAAGTTATGGQYA